MPLCTLQDVQSRRSLAIHHATFCLTDEAMDEPARVLREAVAAKGLSADAFVATQHGIMFQTGTKLLPEELLGGEQAGAGALLTNA